MVNQLPIVKGKKMGSLQGETSSAGTNLEAPMKRAFFELLKHSDLLV